MNLFIHKLTVQYLHPQLLFGTWKNWSKWVWKRKTTRNGKKEHPHRNRLVDWQLRPQRLFSWWVNGWEMSPSFRLGLRFWYLKLLKIQGFDWKKRGSFVGIVKIGDGCPVADFLEKYQDDLIGDGKKKQKNTGCFHTLLMDEIRSTSWD